MDFKYDPVTEQASLKLRKAEADVLRKAMSVLKGVERMDPNFEVPGCLSSLLKRINEKNEYTMAPAEDDKKDPDIATKPQKDPASTTKPQKLGHG